MRKITMKGKFFFMSGLCMLAAFLGSCKDDEKTNGIDPSRPVVFTDFSPHEGSVRTRLYIYGENFGTDPSKIHITIGGQETPAIGCTDTEIYCMIPSRSFDGDIKVSIEDNEGVVVAEHEFEDRFNYFSKTSVETLIGKKDEYGNSGNVDGTFEEARFAEPTWLLLDTFDTNNKYLYVFQTGTSMRKVDFQNKKVSTVITNGQGLFTKMYYSCFDATGDTIFICDDHGMSTRDRVEVSYLLRSENFRKAHAYVYDRTGYSCAYQPLSKSLYYNTWWNADISKAVWEPVAKEMVPQFVFKLYEQGDAGTYLFIHPTGNYMYIVGDNCIYKSMFNRDTNEFQSPVIFAGRRGESQWVDGTGALARFCWPYQGTFVKNPDYVKEGKSDIYDFYLADRHAYAIRKVTPEGVTTTFAGRGTPTADGEVKGYIDGDVRTEARFDEPCGLAYDEETGTFYVTDFYNRCIRSISMQ